MGGYSLYELEKLIVANIECSHLTNPASSQDRSCQNATIVRGQYRLCFPCDTSSSKKKTKKCAPGSAIGGVGSARAPMAYITSSGIELCGFFFTFFHINEHSECSSGLLLAECAGPPRPVNTNINERLDTFFLENKQISFSLHHRERRLRLLGFKW